MLTTGAVLGVGDREQWSDEGGHTSVERLSPRIAVFRTRDYYSDELEYFARSRNVAMLDELVARGEDPAFNVFCDWSEITGYSASARNQSTSFILGRRKQLASVLILFKSPLVAMGINVANVMVGGLIKATTSREEFDARLKRALDGD